MVHILLPEYPIGIKARRVKTMLNWIYSICLGIKIYLVFAGVVVLPTEIIKAAITKKYNAYKIALNQLFILYFICLICVCFFPLPTTEQALSLTYNIQTTPFFFVGDIIRNFSIENICQVLFNVVLTIPLGMFLSYRFNLPTWKIVLISLLLSTVIEFGQFTGLFFIYNGSYRICDVDDLILNTLGGFLGSVTTIKINHLLPVISDHDMVITNRKSALSHAM